MDKSNGHSRRKYEKRCDKHWTTRSKVEWSGVGWIWEAAGHRRSFIFLCVMANRRKDGCSADYLSALKTSLQFAHKFNSSSRQTNCISYLFELQGKKRQLEL